MERYIQLSLIKLIRRKEHKANTEFESEEKSIDESNKKIF